MLKLKNESDEIYNYFFNSESNSNLPFYDNLENILDLDKIKITNSNNVEITNNLINDIDSQIDFFQDIKAYINKNQKSD